MPLHFSIRAAAFIAPSLLWMGCAMTSPNWDYVPESTTTPIPFQAWAFDAEQALQVQCAPDTVGHGASAQGDAGYVRVADVHAEPQPLMDVLDTPIYPVRARVVLPPACWERFDAYGYWQANVRMVQAMRIRGETTQQGLSSFDRRGLSCMRREAMMGTSWLAVVGKCQKQYSNADERIPYVVLRVPDGTRSR